MTVGDARLRKLIDLWVERGCPEKMTIHVRSTGETIVLQEGVPVTIGERRGVQGPTTMFRTCATCRDVFPGHGRGLYCKSLCRPEAYRARHREIRGAATVEQLARLAAMQNRKPEGVGGEAA